MKPYFTFEGREQPRSSLKKKSCDSDYVPRRRQRRRLLLLELLVSTVSCANLSEKALRHPPGPPKRRGLSSTEEGPGKLLSCLDANVVEVQ